MNEDQPTASPRLHATDIARLPGLIRKPSQVAGEDPHRVAELVQQLIDARERALMVADAIDDSFRAGDHDDRDLIGSFAMRMLESTLRLQDEMF